TSSLRSVNIGGAHVTGSLVQAVGKRFAGTGTEPRPHVNTGGPTISVLYGMTEAGGTFATTSAGGDGVVGVAASGVEVRIIDGDGYAAGPGEGGEIIVRTGFAATGYWKDPETTRA